jgi:hypothetical protein
MTTKLLDKLSGTHLTIIACAAILTPGALYGAVTYSNVALINPSTGTSAYVDGGGSLFVVDPYAYYRNFPGNQVDIYVGNDGMTCEAAEQYAVPAGKALILTALSGNEYQSSTSYNYAGVYVYSGPNCTGHILTSHVSSVSQTGPDAPVSVDYGVGIPVPAGATISVFSSNNAGLTFLHGYLVPASTIKAGEYQGRALALPSAAN